MEKTAGMVRWERREGMVRVVLSHPPLNILKKAMLDELRELVEGLDLRGVRVLVVESDQKAFSAGADVGEHLPGEVAGMLRAIHDALGTLLDLPVPSVAAVRGAALGGGLELALSCDFIVASSSAQFGVPEIQLGVFPPLAAVLLPRTIPERRAWEMVLGGQRLGADEARSLGLVNRVFAEETFSQELEGFLATFTRHSAAALRAARRALRLGNDWRERLAEAERLYLEELMAHPDPVEGLTAFLEKRPPRWAE
ncbi:MAG: enoyl-CoA hydratase/isomerase family protein [Armatimonadetes bacterium]|nr:enoyl-CoA hydratase/isomerase family protein [Armatimonadota bacterium]